MTENTDRIVADWFTENRIAIEYSIENVIRKMGKHLTPSPSDYAEAIRIELTAEAKRLAVLSEFKQSDEYTRLHQAIHDHEQSIRPGQSVTGWVLGWGHAHPNELPEYSVTVSPRLHFAHAIGFAQIIADQIRNGVES